MVFKQIREHNKTIFCDTIMCLFVLDDVVNRNRKQTKILFMRNQKLKISKHSVKKPKKFSKFGADINVLNYSQKAFCNNSGTCLDKTLTV